MEHATSHYPKQLWPSSLTSCWITKTQLINTLRSGDAYMRQWTGHRWSGSELSSMWCQAFTWTTSSNRFRGTWIMILWFSLKENAADNVVCQMAAIWSRPVYVNSSLSLWAEMATASTTIFFYHFLGKRHLHILVNFHFSMWSNH